MEQNEQLYKEIKNNARFTVECLSLNHEGQGVCKITGIKDGELFENYPIFVDELLLVIRSHHLIYQSFP